MKFWQYPRQPLAGLFICACLGVIAADHFPVGPVVPSIFLAITAGFAVWRRSRLVAHLFVMGVFFLLHNIRVENAPGKKLANEFSEAPLPVTVTGVALSEPEAKATARDIPLATFRLRLESIGIDDDQRMANAVVMATWRGEPPAYGDRVSITGEAMNIAPPRNPGEFDYQSYARRLGIYSEIRMRYPNDGEILKSDCGNPIIAAAIASRHWMQEKLKLGIEDSPEAAGLIQGMVLGRKNEAPAETRELFQRTGTLHLFVVNGLHIGMFSSIVLIFVRLFGAGRRLSAVILIPLICFYALLTGLSPGSVRAAIMAAIFFGARLAERKPVSINNLAAAGLAILLWDTNELFMPGCQFSFGVVIAIILLAEPLQKFFAQFGAPDSFIPRPLWSSSQKLIYAGWRRVAGLLGVSTAAFAGSLPFTAFYYHIVSLSAVVANLVIVTLAYFVLAGGFISILLALFSDAAAACFNIINKVLAKAVLYAVAFFAQIPLGHVYVSPPQFGAPACEIEVLDLSAGSAIYIRTGRRDWVIDCGSAYSYKSVVCPFLRSRGVNRLDGFIASHDGANFNGALDQLKIDFSPVEAMSFPSANSRNQRNAGRGLSQGDSFAVTSSAKIRVLYPPSGLKARTVNDRALVLQLECEGRRMLILPGNSDAATQWLLENVHDLRGDFLIESQNGSGIAANLAFIDAVQPKAIVCLSTDFPKPAQIDETWCDEVAKRGIQLFRQDRTGAVRIGLNRDDISAQAFLGDQVFFSKSR